MKGPSRGLGLVRILAEVEARGGRFDAIEPEHLWMGLTKLVDLSADTIRLLPLDEGESRQLSVEIEAVRAWFTAAELDPTGTRRRLRRLVGRGTGSPEHLHRSPESLRRFRAAAEHAIKANAEQLDACHLAQSLRSDPSEALAKLLADIGVARDKAHDQPTPQDEPAARARSTLLAQFGRDLTAQAAAGALEPLIGRREELRRLAQVLAQKLKGNACLVGDPGVGKTRIVEGLAQRLARPACHPALAQKRIVELSVASLLAGTQHRGDLEQRIEGIVREAASDPNLILFVDEFHTVMARGGGLDMASLFKPALARREVQMIAATTTREYERHVASDDAMARRFEIVWVEEPSREDALEVVRGVKPGLEEHHGLLISDEALEAAVDLSIRFLPDQRLPDKALDLLDQAASQRALRTLSVGGKTAQGTLTLDVASASVGRADVARAVAARSRMPYELVAMTDRERTEKLGEHLAARVIGQPEALDVVTSALRTAYGGLKDPGRPLASFLFAGPTGVGKTETAKALAEYLFGCSESLVRIDLSEYTEKHQVARLLGAPPGYVGYQEPGMLTSALRRRPASVVLFDEVEKAHTDVLNILLQILDDAVLTDGQGRKASFREAVIILTSNCSPAAADKRVGFGREPSGAERHQAELGRLLDVLERHLRPELLGRLQHIVLYRPLADDALRRIAHKAFDEVARRAEAQGLLLPEALRGRVLASLPEGQFGARDIARHVAAEVARWLQERERLAEAGMLPASAVDPDSKGELPSA